MTSTKHLLTAILVLGSLGSRMMAADAPLTDLRPPFDKSGHAGTVWSETNPWFPLNLSRTHQVPGGPDHAWRRLSEDPVTMWRQVAEIIVPYGMTGLQPAVGISPEGGLLWDGVCRQMLEGFAQAGNGARVQIEAGCGARTNIEACVKGLCQIVKLLDHPAAYRLDGRPVISLFSPRNLPPEGWLEVFRRVEAATRQVVWLMNASGFARTPDLWLQYLRVFDGISGYIPTGASQAYLDQAAALIKQFPHKVFEGTVGQTYFVHFHFGGVVPSLTRNYRESWQRVLAAKPDSVTLCNFFDIYENSRMFPNYQSEDILLRIAQSEISRWRGQAQDETTEPDLYVANPIATRIGAEVAFEVIGFPLAGTVKEVTASLDICDEGGRVLHAFEPRRMTLDTLCVERFALDTLPLAAQRALCPRLRYAWNGVERTSDLMPHTSLVTGLRPNVMYWARSLKRMASVNRPGAWRLDGQPAGGTVVRPAHGPSLIEGRIMPAAWEKQPVANHQQEPPRHGGGGRVRILRNGRELESFSTAYSAAWHLNFVKPILLPDPQGAMDWYNIEFDNPYGAEGQRYLSPPIWVVSGSRNGRVTLPVLNATGGVQTVAVEAARVPYYYYPCDRDTGPLLLDVSGYEHHGYLAGRGYGGGHLGHTGYRHEHTPLKGVPPLPEAADGSAHSFGVAPDGKGFLQFNGTNYAMIQGGTAFPLAATYEVEIRTDRLDAPQNILGAGNQSIVLSVTTNGIVEARRSGAVARCQKPVAIGRWHRIAAVYDLRELRLYLDGNLEASVPVPPRESDSINPVVIGGGCAFPFIPRPSFQGGLRQIRFYGRNLAPDEFLQ